MAGRMTEASSTARHRYRTAIRLVTAGHFAQHPATVRSDVDGLTWWWCCHVNSGNITSTAATVRSDVDGLTWWWCCQQRQQNKGSSNNDSEERMAMNVSHVLDYTYPRHPRDAGLPFNVLYYGVAIPVSYVGNLFTYIIVCKVLRYRDSTSDVLIGGLALNDVLTATIVFTPSLISAARGQYFGSRVVCEFSAVTTVWYIYTTFAMLVLISADRWLALTKPFRYKQLLVTGFKLKVIMAFLGFFCLMLASLPLLRYPVVLKAGWYCAPVDITYTHVSSTSPGVCPVQETLYIKMVYLLSGIFLLVSCNLSIAFTLKARPFGDAASRVADRKFTRIMGVVATLFLFTWLPNLTAQAACLAKSPVCPTFEFWAMRIVNVGVAVNPFVYGVMKTTYRRGYLYLVRVSLHYLTCTLLPLPTYGEEIFDLRERVQVRSSRSSSHSVTRNTPSSPEAPPSTPKSLPEKITRDDTQHLSDIREKSPTERRGMFFENEKEESVEKTSKL
ncbi:trace amine-associated receptor 7e-like [Babylonia areolata]|uniref:trace amine-associated receptor 7e-like n=1 Tax=Babylonia areolata TaxID=304850 RepID=UPI003FD0142E